jgi:bacterial/archaeal transporter family-2 protein
MMNLYFFLPLALGVTVLSQATLNRALALQWGLAAAVTLNAAVFFVLSIGFLLIAKYTPSVVPEFWRFQQNPQNFQWYYLLPGLCGFFLVLGLPWSIQNLGASTSFLLLIASQIISSLLFEHFHEGTHISFQKLIGALLVMIGAYLTLPKGP